jgi:hypothetical protein
VPVCIRDEETDYGGLLLKREGRELCKCDSGRGEPAKQRKAEKAQQKKVKQSSKSKAVKQNLWLSS